jgi:hypothetical protein
MYHAMGPGPARPMMLRRAILKVKERTVGDIRKPDTYLWPIFKWQTDPPHDRRQIAATPITTFLCILMHAPLDQHALTV